MSRIDYSIKAKGSKLLSADDVWTFRGGKYLKNKKYIYYGKIDMSMPNMIISASPQDKKVRYIMDTSDLTATQKRQIIDYFYNERGKRNKRTVAYIVKPKK